jgi:hypothetical protein
MHHNYSTCKLGKPTIWLEGSWKAAINGYFLNTFLKTHNKGILYRNASEITLKVGDIVA